MKKFSRIACFFATVILMITWIGSAFAAENGSALRVQCPSCKTITATFDYGVDYPYGYEGIYQSRWIDGLQYYRFKYIDRIEYYVCQVCGRTTELEIVSYSEWCLEEGQGVFN